MKAVMPFVKRHDKAELCLEQGKNPRHSDIR